MIPMPARSNPSWPRFRRDLSAHSCGEQTAADLADTAHLAQLGVPRWLGMALPDDVRQEVALALLEHPGLTEAAQRDLIRWRCARLRYEVWERSPRHAPSKPRRTTGYRTNSARHSQARMKVTPERRSEIARIAQAARAAKG